ncbi:MAG: aldo/keto reductase [Chloroflexi bacterium]|nr:aldo/keto reductase [Chloroflexota bacterium]
MTEEKLAKVRQLNELARARSQSLTQMALAWVLRRPEVTSALSRNVVRGSQSMNLPCKRWRPWSGLQALMSFTTPR